MNEIFTDKMFNEIMNALMQGKSYDYSDANADVHITPNEIRIQYQSEPKRESNTKDREIAEFIKFVERMDDELFMEVCESFPDDELDKLQRELDTDNYRNTIKVFTIRTKEIASNKLTEIVNAADAELKRQENIIKEANKAIESIHKELDTAHTKYSL